MICTTFDQQNPLNNHLQNYDQAFFTLITKNMATFQLCCCKSTNIFKL